MKHLVARPADDRQHTLTFQSNNNARDDAITLGSCLDNPNMDWLTVQGLGYPNIAVGHARPPFFNMIDQGVVADPVFSFWLNRNHPEGAGGELVLGGSDPAHYKGEHAW